MTTTHTATVTLQGTPVELGMQLATKLLEQPLNFAADQLTPEELDQFCCALLSATGGLIARKIGVYQAAVMMDALADVSKAEAAATAGHLQ